MSDAFAQLTEEQSQRYRSKVESLGLDPDVETSGHPIMLSVRDGPLMRDYGQQCCQQ